MSRGAFLLGRPSPALRAIEDGQLRAKLLRADTFEKIRYEVAKSFGVSPQDIAGRSKVENVARARFAVCWIMRRVFRDRTSYREISEFMGYVVHSSSLHSVKSCEDIMSVEPAFAAKVHAIEAIILNGQK